MVLRADLERVLHLPLEPGVTANPCPGIVYDGQSVSDEVLCLKRTIPISMH